MQTSYKYRGSFDLRSTSGHYTRKIFIISIALRVLTFFSRFTGSTFDMSPVPAPAGPIVRPWEPSLTQAAGQAFAPVRPQHMPVEPVPVPTVALERPVYPKPVRPAPPKIAMQGPLGVLGLAPTRDW